MGARRPFLLMGVVSQWQRLSTRRRRQLQRDVARIVEGALPGVEVLALELTGKERFCVFVDHPQGVDHALCERVTDVLRPYLDEYSVEVSSPGFDRPLRTKAHFERAVGRPCASRPRPAGRAAKSSPPGSRACRSRTARGQSSTAVDIPYDAIVRANLIDEGTKG